MTRTDKLTRIFKALSADARVRILQLLKERAFCVGALARFLGISQGAASQHLRILRDAGLVRPDRRGYYIHYRLDEKALARWRKALEGLFGSRRDHPRCG